MLVNFVLEIRWDWAVSRRKGTALERRSTNLPETWRGRFFTTFVLECGTNFTCETRFIWWEGRSEDKEQSFDEALTPIYWPEMNAMQYIGASNCFTDSRRISKWTRLVRLSDWICCRFRSYYIFPKFTSWSKNKKNVIAYDIFGASVASGTLTAIQSF